MTIDNGRCWVTAANATNPPLFQNGVLTFQAHYVGWIVSGFFTCVAVIASFWLINKHLIWYTNPGQQRQIVRILFMVPIYATISLLSYIDWKHALAITIFRDCYESVVLGAFFYLLLEYIDPSPVGQKEVFRRVKLERWMFPFGHVKWRPEDGLYFLQLMKWGVLQYCIVRPVSTFASIVLNWIGLYCEDSWSPGWGHIWLVGAISISVSIAMFCLLQLYMTVKVPLAPHKPLLKLFAVKAVVFLTFWQASGLSLFADAGLVKDTKYMTAEDINNGIAAILETFEMMIFAFLHVKAFSYLPYRPADRNPSKQTPRLRSLGHALNFADVFRELGAAWVYMWRRIRGEEAEELHRRQAHLEAAFGRSRRLEINRNWVDTAGYKLELGDEIEREMQRRGGLTEGALRELEAQQGMQAYVHGHSRRDHISWWRRAYNRVSGGGDEDMGGADKYTQLPSPRDGNSRSLMRELGGRDGLDDAPPPSILFRHSKYAPVDDKMLEEEDEVLPPHDDLNDDAPPPRRQKPLDFQLRPAHHAVPPTEREGLPIQVEPVPAASTQGLDRSDSVLDRVFRFAKRSSEGHGGDSSEGGLSRNTSGAGMLSRATSSAAQLGRVLSSRALVVDGVTVESEPRRTTEREARSGAGRDVHLLDCLTTRALPPLPPMKEEPSEEDAADAAVKASDQRAISPDLQDTEEMFHDAEVAPPSAEGAVDSQPLSSPITGAEAHRLPNVTVVASSAPPQLTRHGHPTEQVPDVPRRPPPDSRPPPLRARPKIVLPEPLSPARFPNGHSPPTSFGMQAAALERHANELGQLAQVPRPEERGRRLTKEPSARRAQDQFHRPHHTAQPTPPGPARSPGPTAWGPANEFATPVATKGYGAMCSPVVGPVGPVVDYGRDSAVPKVQQPRFNGPATPPSTAAHPSAPSTASPSRQGHDSSPSRMLRLPRDDVPMSRPAPTRNPSRLSIEPLSSSSPGPRHPNLQRTPPSGRGIDTLQIMGINGLNVRPGEVMPPPDPRASRRVSAPPQTFGAAPLVSPPLHYYPDQPSRRRTRRVSAPVDAPAVSPPRGYGLPFNQGGRVTSPNAAYPGAPGPQYAPPLSSPSMIPSPPGRPLTLSPVSPTPMRPASFSKPHDHVTNLTTETELPPVDSSDSAPLVPYVFRADRARDARRLRT